MIVGTAGHIDHGKTTLVRALTGVDTDRLPEEKRRGISIELGYAFLPTPEGSVIGFIDVPGHERLVHTMLAGATGIDAVMLLVAADDGVMPQTREHLAIVSMLRIGRGAVVVTKCDRADAARVEQVRLQIAAEVRGTPLADGPVFFAAAPRGEGIDAVRGWLFDLAARGAGDGAQESPTAKAFRLAVDRVFTLTGIGTVVTGSVHSGAIRSGEEVAVVPGGPTVRVRGVHAQSRAVDAAHAGQRCALNLAGIETGAISRGDWICDPSVALATDRIDVELEVWPGSDLSVDAGTRVHAHLGAADVVARVVPLGAARLAPGTKGFAQLVLQRPLGAWQGDRMILRDAAATRTIAGGRVLDPYAPARYRKTPERLAMLAGHAALADGGEAGALLEGAAYGVDLSRLCRAGALKADAGRIAGGAVVLGGTTGGGDPLWALSAERWAGLRESLAGALAELHRREPESIGADAARLRRLAAPRADPGLVDRAIERMLADGSLARHGGFLRLPEHAQRLSAQQQRLAERLLPLLEAGGFDPPWVRDLARDVGQPEALVRATLAAQARGGDVFQVVKDLYYHVRAVERLAAIVRSIAGAEPEVRAGAFRDATGLGRKRAIQILEFFDRVGLLRRVRDSHMIRPGSSLFADDRPGS